MGEENPQKPQDQNQSVTPANKPHWREWLPSSTSITAIATALIAIFALWQSCLTRISIKDQEAATDSTLARVDSQMKEQRRFDTAQLYRADSQLGISHKTMIEQLRPYVFATAYGEKFLINDNSILLQAINIGQTPAYHLQTWMSSRIIAISDTSFFNRVIHQLRMSPIGGIQTLYNGGQPIQLYERLYHNDIVNLLNDATQNKAIIFIWGKFLYADAFGEIHHSTFKFRSSIPFDGFRNLIPCDDSRAIQD